MYKTIEADCILANLLHKYPQISIRDLNRAQAAINKEIGSIYVDVTKNALIRAVNRWPDMFEWNDNMFRRLRELPASEVDETFNWRIPADVRCEIFKILDSITIQELEEK